MPLFKKESLETLRQRIDLVEVLEPHIELKKQGASYKALCPFHDEKTPSFVVQKGDSHYHCFGCGAHGDAIQFLMNHLKMSFGEAIESLAQKFNVHMEVAEGVEEPKGPPKAKLREALDLACRFFHFYLLNTPEGHEALHYLYNRGVDLSFIQRFQIGLAPDRAGVFRQTMYAKGVTDEILLETGLIAPGKGKGYRDFFIDRITFPIHSATGAVIGFSGRKYKEETFGGKYVNTPETQLFKKSRVLYGMHHCRRRIAKERKAIICEGQIDTLRLIQEGLNIAVAAQGTAFGEGHVKELVTLGVNTVYLAMDGDKAGVEATEKIGNLFQKEGIEAHVVPIPTGSDPDTYLSEHGIESFIQLLDKSSDYLTFLVQVYSRQFDMSSPAGKNQLVNQISAKIRSWDHPLMVHESLRKLASLAHVPENIVGVGQGNTQNIYLRKSASVGVQTIDPNRIMETDFIRWILLMDQNYLKIGLANLTPEDLQVKPCRQIYQTFITRSEEGKSLDPLSLSIDMDDPEAKLVLSEILQKKVNPDKSQECFSVSIQKILERNWMEKREEIKMQIQSGNCSDEKVLDLVKQFDSLKREVPAVRGI